MSDRAPFPSSHWFKASEVEMITGRSQTNQRNDRRAGYTELSARDEAFKRHGIKPPRGYDYEDLARCLTLQVLADRSVDLTTGSAIAKQASDHVAYWALEQDGAIEDQTDGAYKRVWGGSAASQFVTFEGRKHPFRYFVSLPNGDAKWGDDLSEVADAIEAASGAAIVLPLKALGELMIKRAPRPVAKIEFVDLPRPE